MKPDCKTHRSITKWTYGTPKPGAISTAIRLQLHIYQGEAEVHKSLRKQLALIAFFGPFGLLYTNTIVALALVFATLLAIYSSASSMNTVQFVLVGTTTLAISFVSGIYLVGKHNRQVTKEFELSSYRGGISYTTVRSEPLERDYHATLSKIRRKKAIKNTLILCLASLCITYSVLIIKPHTTFLETELQHTPTAETTSPTAIDTSQPLSRDSIPSWNHKLQNKTFISSLEAMDYIYSGDVPYLPKLHISCHENTDIISLRVNEILGTETTSISMILDDSIPASENWTLDASYQVADTHLSTRLLSQLKSAATISLLYKPFGQEEVKTARFNLTGSTEAISKFKNSCSQLHSIASI